MKAQLEDAVARSLGIHPSQTVAALQQVCKQEVDEMAELDLKAEPADPRPADPRLKTQADPQLVVKKEDCLLYTSDAADE